MGKKRKKKKSSGEVLVVQARVKDFIRDKGFRTGSDFVDALSDEVEVLIENAIGRAETNAFGDFRFDGVVVRGRPHPRGDGRAARASRV